MQPGVVHQGVMEVIEPCALAWVVFDPGRSGAGIINEAELALLASAFARAGNVVFPAPPALNRELVVMCEALAASEDGEALAMVRFRSSVVSVLCRAAQALRAGKGAAAEWPGLAGVLDHIRLHLGERITAAELACASGLHSSAFHRRFSDAMGLSPIDYVTRERIALARKLLGTGKTVTDIAHELGFSSSQHFSTTFGRLTGTPPTAYRRALVDPE